MRGLGSCVIVRCQSVILRIWAVIKLHHLGSYSPKSSPFIPMPVPPWLHCQGLWQRCAHHGGDCQHLTETGPRVRSHSGIIYWVTEANETVLLRTYLASNLVVMEVHERPGVLFDFPCVDEHFGEVQAVADVRRAAPPLPALVYAV